MLWLLLFVGLFGVKPAAAQQVTFLNITAPYQGLSTQCISVLNQVVACDPKLLQSGGSQKYQSDETLKAICTTDCTNNLNLWVRRVAGTCGTSRYKSGQASILASFMAQSILEDYSVLCLKNTQGQYCNAVMSSAIKAAATGTVAPTVGAALACHTCAASMLSTRLQLPIGNGQTELASAYASMTSSCKITGKSVTPLATTTTWVEMAPTPTPQCNGTTYSVKSGDNCRSVALSQGIGTTNLLLSNKLQAFCANFPTSGSLCIPSAQKCKAYQLKTDLSDDCRTIAKANGVTWAQIVSWNPEVGEYCENIVNMASEGQVICVTTPGGTYVNPSPQEPEPSSTSEPETYFTLPPTPFASAPLPQFTPPYPMAGYIDPIANDTIYDCSLHRAPPVNVNASSSEVSYKCSDYAKFYGITMDKLVEWNPSIKERLKDNDCMLWAGEQYCAQRDLDTSAEIIKSCVKTEVAESGPRSTCDGFIEWHDLQKTDFLAWNPGLGSDCGKFHSGYFYCTQVHGYRPTTPVTNCVRWHITTTDDMKDKDPCGRIEKKYGIAQHARFVNWNPTLKTDCSGIRLGYEYCVGTPAFPGTGS